MDRHKHNDLVELLRQLEQRDFCHVSVTPASHERVNNRPDNRFAHDLKGIFGWSRPFSANVAGDTIFELMRCADILRNEGSHWRSRLRVSSIGADLFLHSAFPTNASDSVFFGPDTYRFIDALEQFLNQNSKGICRAVDIGTGSGAGAITLARALPECQVFGVDINDYALELAKVNALAKNIANIEFLHSDLLSGIPGSFDLIIANPPYLVDASQRAYRHGGGPLGAGLSLAIVDAAIKRLNAGGTLLLYTGVAIQHGHDAFEQACAAKLKLAGFNYQYREVDPDVFGEELFRPPYAHTDRISAVVLTADKPYWWPLAET